MINQDKWEWLAIYFPDGIHQKNQGICVKQVLCVLYLFVFVFLALSWISFCQSFKGCLPRSSLMSASTVWTTHQKPGATAWPVMCTFPPRNGRPRWSRLCRAGWVPWPWPCWCEIPSPWPREPVSWWRRRKKDRNEEGKVILRDWGVYGTSAATTIGSRFWGSRFSYISWGSVGVSQALRVVYLCFFPIFWGFVLRFVLEGSNQEGILFRNLATKKCDQWWSPQKSSESHPSFILK